MLQNVDFLSNGYFVYLLHFVTIMEWSFLTKKGLEEKKMGKKRAELNILNFPRFFCMFQAF